MSSVEASSIVEVPVTIQTKLVGNILAFWDCTVESAQLKVDETATCLVILERSTVQLCDPTKTLPFRFSLSFEKDPTVFYFSTFTAEERDEWMLMMSGASREIAQAQVDELVERVTALSVPQGGRVSVATSSGEVASSDRNAPPGLDEKLLAPILTAPIKRVHHFVLPTPNGPSRKIACEEWMYESKLSIVLPTQLLKLYRRWSQELKAEFDERLQYLPTSWHEVRQWHIRQLSANIEYYNEALEFLDAYSGPHFRSSVERLRVAFASVPINLHVQRFCVNSDESGDWQSFDALTSGCCAAVPLRFQNGGLRRLRGMLEGGLSCAEAIDSSLDARFWSRRSVLLELKQRVGSLSVEVERNWTGEPDKFNNGRAGFYLLSELKELRGIINDWTATFPGVGGAVEEMVHTELHYHCQLRSDVVLSQALTTVCTSVLARIVLLPESASLSFIESWPKLGPLFNICSLLSCHGDDKGMMEDMSEAWRLVRQIARFRFVRSFSSVAQTCIPLVEGTRAELIISIPLADNLFKRLPQCLADGALFRVMTVFWNVGINYEASFVQTMGDPSLERHINLEALADIVAYVDLFRQFKPKESALVHMVADLTQSVQACPSNKNIKIIKMSVALTRTLGGISLISCKSGKDRTAMAVTLEEGHILRENCGVTEQQLAEMVVALRRDGVRRENCRKNVGKPLYSFSPLQMPFMPKEMRPPAGTYGQQIQS
uniref:PH domain-containing protein n=1 Tax=Plectus sambesii TaxID=2011161 RepID=A0A914UXV8_9BILA